MRIGKYESSEGGGSVGTAVTFLLIGLGAGALVGLLLAPTSGKQLRKDLRGKFDDARDAMGEFADEARDRVKDHVEDALDRGSEIADKVREKVAPLTKGIRRG